MASELKTSLKLTWQLTWLSVLATLWGCATYPDQQNPAVPAALDRLFTSCSDSDGAMALKAYNGEALLGSAEAEWIAKTSAWTLQILSPFGQSMLSLRQVEATLVASGMLAAKLPPITVRGDGFLEVDGHFVGVKADEIPCLLAGTLPDAWRSYLVAAQSDGAKQRLWFDDDIRVTKVTTVQSSASIDPRMFCSQTKWGSFLFGGKLLVCRHLTGDRKATLTGIGSYRLEWVPL